VYAGITAKLAMAEHTASKSDRLNLILRANCGSGLSWEVGSPNLCCDHRYLLHARTNPFLARDRELTTQIRLAACLNSGLLEGYRGALFVVSACGRRPDGTTAPRRCIIARILSYLTTVSWKGVSSAFCEMSSRWPTGPGIARAAQAIGDILLFLLYFLK